MKLSPSALDNFTRCPRCFYMDRKLGVTIPRGIFPSFPGGMDRKFKVHYDIHRIQGKMPPEIEGKVTGKLLPDQDLLNDWRNNRGNSLNYIDKESGVLLTGAVDDCVLEQGGLYSPLDYKTRGSAAKEHPAVYYQGQLDNYALMMEMNGYKISGHAWLISYFPLECVVDNAFPGLVLTSFKAEVFKISVSPKNALEKLREAAKCLQGRIPSPSENCERCIWFAATASHVLV